MVCLFNAVYSIAHLYSVVNGFDVAGCVRRAVRSIASRRDCVMFFNDINPRIVMTGVYRNKKIIRTVYKHYFITKQVGEKVFKFRGEIMFSVDIDQMSFVIRYEQDTSVTTVDEQTQELLFKRLEKALRLTDIIGERVQKSGSVGYDMVYAYADMVRISYSQKRLDMGMYVWFSASAVKDYKIIKGIDQLELINIIDDFVMSQNPELVDWHLSLIDLACDFVDMALSVDDLGTALNAGRISLITTYEDKKTGQIKERPSRSKVSTVVTDGVINTIYVGSRKSKTNFLFRIYNKKLEQQENRNKRYTEIMNSCNDWVRLEFSFRKDYAKAITSYLYDNLTSLNMSDFCKWLMARAVERIAIYEIKEEKDGKFMLELHETTKVILNASDGSNDLLSLPPEPINNLYDYYLWQTNNDSGLIGWLWRVNEVYGRQAIDDFYARLDEQLYNYVPSDNDKRYVAKSDKYDNQICPWMYDEINLSDDDIF